MDTCSAILAHTQRYCSDLERVLRNSRPGDGLWGLGNDPKKHPCHMAFYEAVEESLSGAPSLPEAELDRVVTLVLGLDEAHPEQPEQARLMLQAVQGLTLPLLPRLSRTCAGELAQWYAQRYPRRIRLPNQSRVLRALEQRAKGR